jgi:hypothetical protein
MSTLFDSFELNELDGRRLVVDLISSCSDAEVAVITRVVQSLVDGFAELPNPRVNGR